MRLWTLHPQYLDTKGLTAAWREGLLAKKVLEGKTEGYTRHPQLERFRTAVNPLDAINAYLGCLWTEACIRGYSFDKTKIEYDKVPANPTTSCNETLRLTQEITTQEGIVQVPKIEVPKIEVTSGQVMYEYELLKSKLAVRDPDKLAKIENLSVIMVNPVFCVRDGGIERWEKVRPEIVLRLVNQPQFQFR
ncbi:MAG TPA: pyrimidine dimer DNA glycosylase/endonuclease V [Spirochaetales bacterium]|nr:pyrimidine dimer DNA glycosylase/endonuclease V [Spirochaetales bacterium]